MDLIEFNDNVYYDKHNKRKNIEYKTFDELIDELKRINKLCVEDGHYTKVIITLPIINKIS